MQDAKQILEKVKQFFNELTNPAAVDQAEMPAAPTTEAPKMTDYELKDGGMVSIDKLEVGGTVMIDGNAALPGDIQLKDGTSITIGDNGVITEIEMPSAPEEVAPAMEDMSAKFEAFTTATNEKFAAYESKFADYEAKLSKANKVIEELLKLSQLIVDAPAAQPDSVVKTSNAFKEEAPKKDLSILFN
jgi:exosome complex RNA-binding protein Rrp4